MQSKSCRRIPDLPAAIEENLSDSGFYCTLDLEQNAELRILLHCYCAPDSGRFRRGQLARNSDEKFNRKNA